MFKVNEITHRETCVEVRVFPVGPGTEADAVEAAEAEIGHLYGGVREVQWSEENGDGIVILDRD